MYRITLTTILLLILCCAGCRKQPLSDTDANLHIAEQLWETNPDSASIILNKIEEPENLDDETFAKWCLLHSNLSHEELFTEQIERAAKWYKLHGTTKENTQILLGLGKSLADQGDYDQAMTHYINAYEIAQKNKLYNMAGQLSCYMGDLYEQINLIDESIKKYRLAAGHFKTAGNMKSYVCALRDLGRDYALSDSVTLALQVILHADSISSELNNINVRSSIKNALGNIYLMCQEYEKAEGYFLNALQLGENKLPNYAALIELYIQTNALPKAYKILDLIPHDNPEYSYNISDFYYKLYKAEGKYQKATEKLEECNMLLNSVVYAENQSKILEIEKRYDYLKMQTENSKIKIVRQKAVILSAVCVCIALLVLLVYFLSKKRATDRTQKQQSGICP